MASQRALGWHAPGAKRRRRLVALSAVAGWMVAVGLVAGAGSAAAAASAQDRGSDEQVLITQAQSTVDLRLAAELDNCRSRFAVSDCVSDAQRRHRTATQPLRERQLRLDDAERERKAALRRQAIADKARAAAARSATAAPQTDLRLRTPQPPPVGRGSASNAEPAADADRASAPLDSAGRRVDNDAPQSAAQRQREHDAQRATDAAAAQARVQAAKERASQAAETRARIDARQAERAASGKPPAAPLPVPGASASKNGN